MRIIVAVIPMKLAIGPVIPLVARKSDQSRSEKEIFNNLEVLLEKLKQYQLDQSKRFEVAGWKTQDIGMSIFAQGVGLLCNYQAIEDESTRLEILKKIADFVAESIPEFRITQRKSI